MGVVRDVRSEFHSALRVLKHIPGGSRIVVKTEVVVRGYTRTLTCGCIHSYHFKHHENEATRPPLKSELSGLSAFVLSAILKSLRRRVSESEATPTLPTCFSFCAIVRVTGVSTQTPFQVNRPAAVRGMLVRRG